MDFNDFTNSKEFNDIFGGIFGKDATPVNLYVGQDVTAQISPFVTVRGSLVSKPTTLNVFCVVDGYISHSGKETRDERILVPLNLLKAKQ